MGCSGFGFACSINCPRRKVLDMELVHLNHSGEYSISPTAGVSTGCLRRPSSVKPLKSHLKRSVLRTGEQHDVDNQVVQSPRADSSTSLTDSL